MRNSDPGDAGSAADGRQDRPNDDRSALQAGAGGVDGQSAAERFGAQTEDAAERRAEESPDEGATGRDTAEGRETVRRGASRFCRTSPVKKLVEPQITIIRVISPCRVHSGGGGSPGGTVLAQSFDNAKKRRIARLHLFRSGGRDSSTGCIHVDNSSGCCSFTFCRVPSNISMRIYRLSEMKITALSVYDHLDCTCRYFFFLSFSTVLIIVSFQFFKF